MNLENAKKALIDFQKKHESYLDAAKQYQEYQNLPFWKKWITKKVVVPERNFLHESFTLFSSVRGNTVIELRMYFSGTRKDITLAINEGGCGYMVDIDTGEKSYYLGRVNPNVSKAAEVILEAVRKKLAKLYIV